MYYNLYYVKYNILTTTLYWDFIVQKNHILNAYGFNIPDSRNTIDILRNTSEKAKA